MKTRILYRGQTKKEANGHVFAGQKKLVDVQTIVALMTKIVLMVGVLISNELMHVEKLKGWQFKISVLDQRIMYLVNVQGQKGNIGTEEGDLIV